MKLKKFIVIIIIIIFILIGVINLFREAIIFREFSKRSQEYTSITNFYRKILYNDYEVEIWRKDNKAICKTQKENETIIEYYDGEYIFEITEGKAIKRKLTNLPTIEICPMYVSNLFWAVLSSSIIDVENANIDNIECYKISVDNNLIYKILERTGVNIKNHQMFIRKADWLLIKDINDTEIKKIEYKINTVTDKDVEMPNMENIKIIT